MGIMIIPFVSSLSDDFINAVPQALRDGAYSLGPRWISVRKRPDPHAGRRAQAVQPRRPGPETPGRPVTKGLCKQAWRRASSGLPLITPDRNETEKKNRPRPVGETPAALFLFSSLISAGTVYAPICENQHHGSGSRYA
jgi:hypothetical protein